jgi:hypothetical protein
MVVTKVCLSMCGCGRVIRRPALSRCRNWRRSGPSAAVEQDRPAAAAADGCVDGPPHGRQRDEDDLGAFAAHARHPVAVLSAGSAMSAVVAPKMRRPGSPSMGGQREVARAR